MATKKIKPATKSTTILCSGLGIIASVVAIASKPDLYSKLGKCANTFDQAGIAKVFNDLVPVVTLLAGVGSTFGRFRVGDLYTPKGILGPNKEELVEEENTLSDQVSLLRDIKTMVQTPIQPANVASIVVEDLASVDLEALAQELDK